MVRCLYLNIGGQLLIEIELPGKNGNTGEQKIISRETGIPGNLNSREMFPGMETLVLV